ncbi:MAG TPA: YncE family protein, partial [Mycobacterium sp.]
TNEITASIPMYANAIAISPDGTRAYIGGGTEQQGGFSVVDLATNTVITTVPIEGGPVFVYVNRAGNLAYVTTSSHNPGGEGVTVLRLATV